MRGKHESSSQGAGKREPFSGKSLPHPGESLGDAALDLLLGRALALFSVGVTVLAVAAIEFVTRWFGSRTSPWTWLTFGILITLLGGWDFYRMLPKLRTLRLGIRGEREVGQMLEKMRSLGYEVFHDIPGDGFNVDHALVGPGGVFAIETKVYSLPQGRRGEVRYDGQQMLVDGKAPDRDPVAQAKASADHLRDLLKRMTGHDVSSSVGGVVRPVVLVPKWWVHKQPRGVHVWVLNPEILPSFLENEPERLLPEEIALYSDRITVHLTQG